MIRRDTDEYTKQAVEMCTVVCSPASHREYSQLRMIICLCWESIWHLLLGVQAVHNAMWVDSMNSIELA
jgi:hypothetical protein